MSLLRVSVEELRKWAESGLEVRLGVNYQPGQSGAVALVLYVPRTLSDDEDEAQFAGYRGYERGHLRGVFPMRREVVRLTCPAFASETKCKRMAALLIEQVGARLTALGINVVLLVPNRCMWHTNRMEGTD